MNKNTKKVVLVSGISAGVVGGAVIGCHKYNKALKSIRKEIDTLVTENIAWIDSETIGLISRVEVKGELKLLKAFKDDFNIVLQNDTDVRTKLLYKVTTAYDCLITDKEQSYDRLRDDANFASIALQISTLALK